MHKLISLVLLLAVPVAADEFSEDTLKELTGIRLLVETISPALQEAGLSEETLQVATARHLSGAGIRLLDHAAWLATDGGQYLYLNVENLVEKNTDAQVYLVRLELRQDVHLARDPMIKAIGATTWRSSRLGIAPTAEAAAQIRTAARSLIDEFIAAWKSSNPTPPPDE